MMISLTQKRLHLDKPPAVILMLLCAGGGHPLGTWPVALGCPSPWLTASRHPSIALWAFRLGASRLILVRRANPTNPTASVVWAAPDDPSPGPPRDGRPITHSRIALLLVIRARIAKCIASHFAIRRSCVIAKCKTVLPTHSGLRPPFTTEERIRSGVGGQPYRRRPGASSH